MQPAPSGVTTSGGSRGVLIADPDPHSRRLLRRLLTDLGHPVVEVEHGEAALRELQGPEAPRLAILAWSLPGLDGPEVCRKLRSVARARYPHLLLVRARAGAEDVIGGLRAGADDYISQPFDAREVEARLLVGRRALELQEELLAAREALRDKAMRDSLTGLLNRTAMIEIVTTEIARARREGHPFALLLADLDHFKEVNDRLGHLAGDRVLVEAARRMRQAVRPYDGVARYGGEEFLIVLPGADRASAPRIAERLRAAVGEVPVVSGGRSIPVTISVGVAVAEPAVETGWETLLRTADEALYRAKAAGRNRVMVG